MIHLDGSTLEGGGQLTRVALSLSAITGVPIHIANIRAGRGADSFSRRAKDGKQHAKQFQRTSRAGAVGKKTSSGSAGLKESHLAALLFLAQECHADVEGAEVGSTEITICPSRRKTHSQPTIEDLQARQPNVIELKNPGSVWLIFQAIYPFIVFRLLPSRQPNSASGDAKDQSAFRIRVKGGTNAPKAMSTEYMQQVFCPIAQEIGLPSIEINVLKRGWTTGKAQVGEVEITIYSPVRHDEAGKEDDGAAESVHGKTKEGDNNQSAFQLPPFTLMATHTRSITSINVTTLTGSSTTAEILETTLTTALHSHPIFPPSVPLTFSNSPSGDERRLYILLVARLSDSTILGRDYLSPGRSMTSDTDRSRICREASQTVVAHMIREIERGGAVDEFMQDQLVIFQALASGRSVVDGGDYSHDVKKRNGKRKEKHSKVEDEDGEEVGNEHRDTELGSGSLHTRTVRWVCREILGTRFDGNGGCEGGGGLQIQERNEGDELVGQLEGLHLDDGQ
jgi:RNA 3'-terminal phosphate cyclase (ATP)